MMDRKLKTQDVGVGGTVYQVGILDGCPAFRVTYYGGSAIWRCNLDSGRWERYRTFATWDEAASQDEPERGEVRQSAERCDELEERLEKIEKAARSHRLALSDALAALGVAMREPPF